ncbi:MAG: TonB-dependent receptor, partial [Cyclobacteriaceae bacterium]|nr:TonB-dependent receptor [Cyclobacteriaceae bacterium]
VSQGETINISLDEKRALESGVFLGLKQDLAQNLSVEYGIRYSLFHYLGGGRVYTFGDTLAGIKRPVADVRETKKNEIVASYGNPEPRAAIKYQLGPRSSLKASYNRMAQYIHLISNTTASNPLDLWTPTTNVIQPQLGNQLALGYFRNFSENSWESSVEFYYKRNQNQIDYIDGALLFFNAQLEGELLTGNGKAYGMEVSVRKNTGSFTGWISYTLGRSLLRVDGISNGNWYPTRYDQLHNLNLSAYYDLSKRVALSSNFVVNSGTPFTSPNGRFEQQGYVVPLVDSRNAGRVPYTHRLDLSLTIEGREYKKNGEKRKIDDSFVLSLYNAYMRKNPFTIYFRQQTDRPVAGYPIANEAVMVSIFATVIPGFSYNFKF